MPGATGSFAQSHSYARVAAPVYSSSGHVFAQGAPSSQHMVRMSSAAMARASPRSFVSTQPSAMPLQTYQQPYVSSQHIATPGPVFHSLPASIAAYKGPQPTSVVTANVQDWKALAEAEGKDKQGWVVWNDQVLLRQASKKYGSPVTLDLGHSVPFNECAEWYERGGQDHWFEIDLNTDSMIDEIGEQITGRLFTTRMPRCLDDPTDPDATNRQRFIKKVKDERISKVFPLIEDEEPGKYKSSHLFDFYKHDCNMEVLRRPVEDYNTPSFDIENHTIADLSIALKCGENCLIHCLGGSGRTGTVIIGALQNLGVQDPIGFARGVKSVYLDIKEQEEFLNRQRTIITETMVQKCPELAKDILLMHIDKLAHATALVQTDGEMDHAEVTGLQMVYNLAGRSGHAEAISVNELLSLSPKIAAKIHPESLLHLLGQLDQNFVQISEDEQAITFPVLQALMQINAQEEHSDYKAKTKAQALAKKK